MLKISSFNRLFLVFVYFFKNSLMTKIPVYFMPGLAAGPEIFENILLPNNKFDVCFLKWIQPEKEESLENYAYRMSKLITHKNPVLVGVSFGGILVQEIAKIIATRKIIIVSSVKSNNEFPLHIKLAKKTQAYKLIPTTLLANIDNLVKYALGKNIVAKRIRLYKKYLTVRNKDYLDWAIRNVVLWKQEDANPNIIHIHGEKDEVFPIENIQNAIIVPNGTHIMIINKYKWLNLNLPQLLLT